MPRIKNPGPLLLSVTLLTAHAGFAQSPLGFLRNTPSQTVAMVRDSAGNYFAGGKTSGIPTTPGSYMPSHTTEECEPPGAGSGGARFPCGTGFVAKFGPAGNMIWGTFLGAPKDEGDYVSALAVDPSGNVWVQGSATSAAFPTAPNAPQYPQAGNFLAELSQDGSQLLYSTFLGSAFACCALKFAAQDGLYFVGNGAVKFNPTANQILYSATNGIHVSTPVTAILAEDGSIYAAASTSDPNFPISPGAYAHPSTGYNVALFSLDPNGNLIFSTVVGGSGDDIAAAMTRDSAGNLYISGLASPDFPLTSDAVLSVPYGPVDSSVGVPTSVAPFIAELSADASFLLYSSFLSAELLEMKIDDDGKISGLGNTYAPFSPDGYYPCFPSAYSYVRLSADHPSIEYSTGIPTDPVTGYPLVFDFDTSGTAYVSMPYLGNQFFTTLDVSKAPHSGPVCMAESASNFETSAAPGLLVSIYGPGVGPNQVTPLALDENGRVATELAGTQVLFDGIPAPILSAAPARVDVVVPFGVATSGNTTVNVLRNGISAGTLTYPLAAQSLWFFTADGTGQGSPAINEDGTPNSAQNPAKSGSFVSFFATGAGAVTPMPIDGTIPLSPSSQIGALGITGAWAQHCAQSYSGDVPGLVEGIVQINCQFFGPQVFTFGTPASYTQSHPITYRVYVSQ